MERSLKLLAREWIFFLSLFFAAVSSLALQRLPHISGDELEVVILLALFLGSIGGLERSGLLLAMARWLERRRFAALALLLGSFALAMLVTNDVALMTIVPVTLLLQIERKEYLVILEAIAANAAALFPFASPQNLYLFWHYDLAFGAFVATIAPFAITLLCFILFLALIFRFRATPRKERIWIEQRRAIIYLLFFGLLILVVIKVVSLFFALLALVVVALFDRKVLRIDHFFLGTFFLFFLIADNVAYYFTKHPPTHFDPFWFSLLLSQMISNVPAAIVTAHLNEAWRAILWGVNVGGYGMLWGSLASLIVYRLYSRRYGVQWSFLVKFLLLNFVALLLGIVSYYSYCLI